MGGHQRDREVARVGIGFGQNQFGGHLHDPPAGGAPLGR